MMERIPAAQALQLNLFKGRRQRGRAAPTPNEFNLHVAIADVLRRWCQPSWRYLHIPLGELRNKATAAKLTRMGVTPGWPDFGFFHCGGAVCWLELKRRGGVLSDNQQALAFFLINAGHGYLLTDTFADAVNALKDWGIVPARIAV